MKYKPNATYVWQDAFDKSTVHVGYASRNGEWLLHWVGTPHDWISDCFGKDDHQTMLAALDRSGGAPVRVRLSLTIVE